MTQQVHLQPTAQQHQCPRACRQPHGAQRLPLPTLPCPAWPAVHPQGLLLTGLAQVAHPLYESGDEAVQASQPQDGPQVGGVHSERGTASRRTPGSTGTVMKQQENMTDAVSCSTKSDHMVHAPCALLFRPRKAHCRIESTANTTSESSTTSRTSNSGVATRTPFCIVGTHEHRGWVVLGAAADPCG